MIEWSFVRESIFPILEIRGAIKEEENVDVELANLYKGATFIISDLEKFEGILIEKEPKFNRNYEILFYVMFRNEKRFQEGKEFLEKNPTWLF